MGFIRRRLQAIEGNAVWAAITALSGYLLTLAPSKALSLLFHTRVANHAIVLWSLVTPVLIGILLHVSRDKRSTLNLEIGQSTGPSPNLYLSVTNRGKPTTLAAFCEVVGHPNGVNDYVTGETRCGWEDGTVPRKPLFTNETGTLLVASFKDVIPRDLSEMTIWKVVQGTVVAQNSARWNQNSGEELPGFDLKIRIVGENARMDKKLGYVVRPKTSRGPLEMLSTGDLS